MSSSDNVWTNLEFTREELTCCLRFSSTSVFSSGAKPVPMCEIKRVSCCAGKVGKICSRDRSKTLR